jgi:hypothetical protein
MQEPINNTDEISLKELIQKSLKIHPKTLQKGAFLGCSEMSGILRSGPHFEKPTLWDLLSPNSNTSL